jgi:8-amino-7-oxononanoate synthase
MNEDDLRALAARGVSVPRLIATSRVLSKQALRLFALGSSPYGSLFDRQNLGTVKDRMTVGPPGRPEFNEVAEPPASVINLSAYSYLGLGDDLRVKQAAIEAIERYGTHTGGPRLLCGTARIHVEFEERLAQVFGAAGVVSYSSGYGTNVSVISALFGPGDLVILDRNAHRSLYDGARLSGAAIQRFLHNDLDHLERILRRTVSVRRRLVVVDAVYSMEGQIAPLPDLTDLVHRHGAFLLADEAHAFGVLGRRGRGAVEHFGLDPTAIDLRIGTLSKAIPAVGGFVASDPGIVAMLRYTSAGRVFSAAMTPPDVAAALAAIDILEKEPERVARLQRNAALFRAALAGAGLDTMGSEAAIVPVWMGDREATLAAALALLARGVYVNAILAPGVLAGTERLRCFVTAAHREADLKYAADAIAEVVRPLVEGMPRRRERNGVAVGCREREFPLQPGADE